jgi:ribosomal protein S18 acetylase RimI-like enzyme
MTITYTNDLGRITAEDLTGFFVGWPQAPDPTAHLRILTGSHAVWLALDDEAKKAPRCVGFVQALSDGQFAAFIPLLEVRPKLQGRGIGRELVQRMLDELADHYSIDVVCDESIAPFYEALGLARLVGMSRRNYARQSLETQRRSHV